MDLNIRARWAREVDGRESPFRQHSDWAGPAQEVPNLRHAKARVDVDGKRAKPSAGKDCGEVTRSVQQPQRDPSAWAHARSAQTCGYAQHTVLESTPV